MLHKNRIIIVSLFAGAFALMTSVPTRAQGCTTNQDDAVDCFVKNAVSTGLLVVPSGMTMTQYKAYGVAVSKVLQTAPAAMFLLGMASASADAIPPTNADGTANQAAQNTFVNSLIAAGLNDSIISLPAETTTSQLQQFARELTTGMTGSSGVTISPGGFLRALDGFIIAATSSSGTVNWVQVTTNITTLVTALQTSGLIKLPATTTLANVEQFALDTATAISVYKTSTGKAHL